MQLFRPSHKTRSLLSFKTKLFGLSWSVSMALHNLYQRLLEFFFLKIRTLAPLLSPSHTHTQLHTYTHTYTKQNRTAWVFFRSAPELFKYGKRFSQHIFHGLKTSTRITYLKQWFGNHSSLQYLPETALPVARDSRRRMRVCSSTRRHLKIVKLITCLNSLLLEIYD